MLVLIIIIFFILLKYYYIIDIAELSSNTSIDPAPSPLATDFFIVNYFDADYSFLCSRILKKSYT